MSRWRELVTDLPAIAAIAATYVYFLLFAQFALLDLLKAALAPEGVQLAMAAMGFAGLLASLAAARLLAGDREGRPTLLLRAGFTLATATALLAPHTTGRALIVCAAIAGLATALVTVPLAASLRGFLASVSGRGPGFGLRVGLGTGLAYLVCNLPGVFDAVAADRCRIAALVALAGLGATAFFARSPAPAGAAGRALGDADALRPGLLGLLLAFFALIWLDSAAFAVIQQDAGLKGQTWAGDGQTLLLGVVHFAGALMAGLLIDAGRFRALLFGAFGLFAAALFQLAAAGNAAAAMGMAGPLYAIAVSLYSVALVAYPAYGPEQPALAGRAWRAGLVFGLAGWIGSALGVGMAQSLQRVPPLFLAASLLALVAGLGLGRPRWLEAHGLTLLFAALAVAVAATADGPGPLPDGADGARGRQVYIGEGCIYCHSQYVRPATADEALWGPHRELDRERERPPLIGLRRQGPDLSNAGRRLDAAGLELQLRHPRAVDPDSVMPSYEHLFAPGDPRGPALVAYLESLR